MIKEEKYVVACQSIWPSIFCIREENLEGTYPRKPFGKFQTAVTSQGWFDFDDCWIV